MQNNISELSIRELFENGKYVIPIYQRNYAWGDKEISQLIQDIVDYCIHNSNSKYYIGSLVIHERDRINEVVFETIFTSITSKTPSTSFKYEYTSLIENCSPI